MPPAFVVAYGVSNICIYFDFAPANMILPLFWVIVVVVFMVFFWLKVERMRDEVADGRLSQRLFACLKAATYWEAFTFVAFTLIFAVSPVDVGEPYFAAHLWVHSVPYCVLQTGLLSLAVSSTIHGIQSGYWATLGFGKWQARVSVAYCAVFSVNVLYSNIYMMRCLAMMDPPNPATCTISKPLTELNGAVILLNGLVVPLTFTSFILFCRAERMGIFERQSRHRGISPLRRTSSPTAIRKLLGYRLHDN